MINTLWFIILALFGVALGNVMRGVPFDAQGEFLGSFALLLNPFAVMGGVLSLVLLSLHGAAYLFLKTDGEIQARARRAIGVLWWAGLIGIIAIVIASFRVRPDFTANFLRWPWLLISPLIALGALVMIRRYAGRGAERETFLSTGALIVGLLASVWSGLFPRLLPALEGSSAHPGLDIYNSAAPLHSMRTALGIYLLGMTIVLIYLVRIYRVWRGKVAADAYHP